MSGIHKFVLFHLMGRVLFDLPHNIYFNILRTMKALGGLDDIHYVALINKPLWEHNVYHVYT